MTKRAFDKIMAGLKDAVEGRWARATLYERGKAIQRYTSCRGCSGLTLSVGGRCDSCGDRKLSNAAERQRHDDRGNAFENAFECAFVWEYTFAWLIEKGSGLDLRYYAPTEPGEWTLDHLKACRFARKEDAEAIQFRHVARGHLPERGTRICEHGWMVTRPSQAADKSQGSQS